VDVIFALDILASFNTAFVDVDTGILVQHRPYVYRHYLRGWFALDFASTAPIEAVAAVFTGAAGPNAALESMALLRAVRLVRLVKIARIAKMSGIFDTLERNLGLHPAVLRLLKLLLIMTFCAHLIACVLVAVTACVPGDPASCWVEAYCVGGESWFKVCGWGGRRVGWTGWLGEHWVVVALSAWISRAQPPLHTPLSLLLELCNLTVIRRVLACSAWVPQAYKPWAMPEPPPVGAAVCLADRPLSDKYLVALYFSFTTMTTIGYGVHAWGSQRGAT